VSTEYIDLHIKMIFKKFKNIYFFLIFLNHFDMLILKIIFLKKIILMHFQIKNILKSNSNLTFKRTIKTKDIIDSWSQFEDIVIN
jgi:hypothetical protein